MSGGIRGSASSSSGRRTSLITALRDDRPANHKTNDFQQAESSVLVVIHQRVIYRECFVQCLRASYRDHQIGSYDSIEAWQMADDFEALTPALIVCALDGSDFSCLQRIASLNIPFIVMSDLNDPHQVTQALQAGARGYVPTNLPLSEVLGIIRLVKAGGIYVPPSAVIQIKNEQDAKENSLTDRQQKIVDALRQGLANKQIAYQLNISEHTVKIHIQKIMRKLNVKNRTQIAVQSRDVTTFDERSRRES